MPAPAARRGQQPDGGARARARTWPQVASTLRERLEASNVPDAPSTSSRSGTTPASAPQARTASGQGSSDDGKALAGVGEQHEVRLVAVRPLRVPTSRRSRASRVSRAARRRPTPCSVFAMDGTVVMCESRRGTSTPSSLGRPARWPGWLTGAPWWRALLCLVAAGARQGRQGRDSATRGRARGRSASSYRTCGSRHSCRPR